MSKQPHGEREARVSGQPAREGQQSANERTADDHVIRGYN